MPDTTGRSAWIVVPAPNASARLRLFCFPYAGAGASIFGSWPRALPSDVEVNAIQMPGREARLGEPPITRWGDAVDRLAEALIPSMDRPFAFFGHSLGAALAFELARRLRRERQPGLVHLFVSGRRAPHVRRDEPLTYALPDAQFIAEVRGWMGTPEAVLQNRELLDLFLPLLRADVGLSETHADDGETPLAVPISAYGGMEDEHAPPSAVEAWRAHTTAGFRRVLFHGGHFFLNENRAAMLAELAGELRAIAGRLTHPPVDSADTMSSPIEGRGTRGRPSKVNPMADEFVYLSQNVKVEPLCDQWYAWPHLIPPATAARNITERHLKIMDSYINAPAVHASAAKNPQMLGGPFVDYGGKRVEELKALRDRTRTDRALMIELSGALNDLNALLLAAANGFSLHNLYAQVPPILRGYVELAYDLNNHPTYRVIEPLLYRSRYYDPSTQSLMLSRITGDHRPFVLSTPRLPDEESVHLQMPFADERLDALFQLKTVPQPWTSVRDQFEVPTRSQPLFRSFFSDESPPPYERYQGSGIRWRYFGHACILIETAGMSLLFDPVLSYTYESDVSRYTYADLPERIDYVFITHNHQDHILLETLLQLRHKVRTIVVPRNAYGMLQDPSLKLMFEHIGFDNVIEMSECQTLPLPDGEVLAIPFLGEHADLAIGTKLAYVVRIGRHKLLFAADSCNVEPLLYERVHQVAGDIDVLFIGMECDGAPLSWLYGALMPRRPERPMDQSRRLSGSNFDQAIAIVNQFHCREVYVYAMGQEPWLNYIMSIKYTEQSRPIVESTRLISECTSRGIHAERLFGEKEILIADARSMVAVGAAAGS